MQTEQKKLKGYQRKYLRALAHPLKPVILIGLRGVTDEVAVALKEALDRHELIKIKFVESKSKADKNRMIEALQSATQAHLVGMIGHTAIFFRQNADRDKQKISLPQRPDIQSSP
ncbi:MAG: ribosome assembly RNA-binding protein YhbY [Desulfobacteraceae bacterium]|nr:MAG: ribosome assembly RNA-binding protein YhbY [Desulfobacteraceae bacterium]